MADNTLAAFVHEKFSKWAAERKNTREEMWDEVYNNFMGRYDESVETYKSNEGKGSRLFVRATQRIVRTAYAKMDAPLRMYDYEFEPDWAALEEAGFDRSDKDAVAKAEEEAKKATETIKAWNVSGETFSRKIPAAILEAEIYGTFPLRAVTRLKSGKKYSFDKTAKRYTPASKSFEYPTVINISPWAFFPDPDNENIQEGEGVVVQHLLTGAQLQKEATALGWDSKVVDALLKDGPKKVDETSTVNNPAAKKSRGDSQNTGEKYSVLEFWGSAQAKLLKEAGIEVFKDLAPTEFHYIEICAYVCQDKILWGAVNPYYPEPYRPFPFWQWDEVPGSVWGIGVAESIRDHQKMINGATRAFFDNVAYGANVMVEINEQALVPGQDMNVYPGKQWVVQAGYEGQAVRPIVLPDITAPLLNMIQLTNSNIAQDSGVDNAQAGIGAPEDQKTATGVAVQKSNANDMYSSRLRRLDEVLEQILEWQARWYIEMKGGDGAIPLKLKANGLLKISTIKELAHVKLQTLMNVMSQAYQLFPDMAQRIDGAEQVIQAMEEMGFENVRKESEDGETEGDMENPLSDERIAAAIGADPAQLPAILAQFGRTPATGNQVPEGAGMLGAGGVMPAGPGSD